MDTKDFEKYAVKDRGISSATLHSYRNYLTPNIMEERELNVTQIDVFSRLMMERVIFLGTEIDDRVSNIIQAQLLYLESTDKDKGISLYVNSPGGGVYSGFGIYDTMQYVHPQITTICTGLAASMAAILLCAGTHGKRLALPHSRIMIHQPMGGIDGQTTDIEIYTKQIKELKEELYEILALHTGQKIEKVRQDGERDYWLKAATAKEYGLIDTVLTRKKK